MSASAIDLPNDLESLRALVLRQQEELATRDAELEKKRAWAGALAEQVRVLEEYIRLLKHHRFGRRSEASSLEQLRLFNEAEAALEGVEAGEEDEEVVVVEAHTRRKRGRRPLPAWIPRIDILHDLAEEEKICEADGTPLKAMGEEISEQLEFIPAELRVLRHIRKKYACPTCRAGVHTAPMPPQPIPKSLASPTLLAQVTVSKYADGLPLYRQERMFQRLGIDLPRATLASWMVKAGELVQPLVNLLREDLLASGFVQCDETRFHVLKEPGRAATSQGYLWAQRGDAQTPTVLYDYDPSRGREVPKRLLEGFEGILQTDGYEGYGELGRQPGIVHVGCWTHCRRRFDEALKAQKKSGKKKRTLTESQAFQGLAFIQKLYKIERQGKDLSPEERTQLRQKRSRPVMEAMRRWLDEALARVPPRSLTGKALAYAQGQWPKLIRVLEDGRIPLDTNLVENSIRPFVVGRKGWLFADTLRGAHASANLYSLIETAKASGLEPFAYLRHLFAELPRATLLAQIEALLPRNLDRSRLQDPRRIPHDA